MIRVQLFFVCLSLLVPLVEGNKGIQYIVEEQRPSARPRLHPLRKPGESIPPVIGENPLVSDSLPQGFPFSR